MYKESIKPEHAERAVAELARFSETVLPLLRKACEHVKVQIGEMPAGGVRHDLAERQIAPAMVRMRMHQLIRGHNLRCFAEGGFRLKPINVKNGAVCLLQSDLEFRILKASKRYPTRPSGYYQEALVEQERYRRELLGGTLFDDFAEPLPAGIIYYHMWQLELRAAYVVIPDGFLDGGGVVEFRKEQLNIYQDLEKTAGFRPGQFISDNPTADGLVLAETPSASDQYDPYQDENSSVLGGTGNGVLDSQSVLRNEEDENPWND